MSFAPGECPLNALVAACNGGCGWIMTQDFCTDADMPPPFLAAYNPMATDFLGGKFPHALAQGCPTGEAPCADGDCPEGDCPEGGCCSCCPEGECTCCPDGECPEGGCCTGCPAGGCPQGGCRALSGNEVDDVKAMMALSKVSSPLSASVFGKIPRA